MPTRTIFFSISQWTRSRRSSTRTQLSVRISTASTSTASTSTADTAWAMMVAQATPATPRWNRITNSRSSPVFSTADTTRK